MGCVKEEIWISISFSEEFHGVTEALFLWFAKLHVS